MATQVLMPALSPTMTEGKIARWIKSEGEAVRAGDVLAEIETDKATMEVEAIDEGVLAKIVIPEGTDHVAVNTPIAVIAGNGEDVGTLEKPAPASKARQETPAEVRPPAPSPPERCEIAIRNDTRSTMFAPNGDPRRPHRPAPARRRCRPRRGG